jgi:hypothetical protein
MTTKEDINLPCASRVHGYRNRCAPTGAQQAGGGKLATAGARSSRGGGVKLTGARSSRGGGVELRVATVNVGTMRGREGEVEEILRRRKIDLCCLQETRWKGGSARMIGEYKFFWIGGKEGISGVGVMIAREWIDSVVEVHRVSDRMMVLRVSIGKVVLNLVSVYAPQIGRPMEEKEEFYIDLGKILAGIEDNEIVMVCGDLNGHVGEKAEGFEGVHGGKGFGSRNVEGEMLLEFAESRGLVIANTWFDKPDARKVSYESGGCRTVVDHILIKRRQQSMVMDVSVIRKEPCIPQHRLMICKLVVKVCVKKNKATFVSKCRIWRLKDTATEKEFSKIVHARDKLRDRTDMSVESVWNELKDCLLEGANEVCGRTKGPPRHRESWWWNDDVANVVKEKQRLFAIKEKSKGECNKAQANQDLTAYNIVKRNANKVIAKAKEAERKKLGEALDRQDEKGKVFRVAKQMVKRNKDVVGGGCVKDRMGKIVVDEVEIKEVWRCYFDKLLNEEFDWNTDSLETGNEVSGPSEDITIYEVKTAIGKMKNDKAAGPSGVVAEMMKAAGDVGIRWMTDLFNVIVREGNIPDDWCKSWMVSIYKGKGDALECGSYRGIKLLEHMMKVLERVIEVKVRRKVEIDDMQFGFSPGKGTTDAIFIVRQIQEKYLAAKKDLWMAFVDLEKAFDRVPREVLWWALRELGVEEWIVTVIKAMYAGASTAVKLKNGESKPIDVRVGVHQGSVLSPLLFIIVLEALSRKFRTGLPFELLYADDLVLVAESEKLLLEKIETWKEGMESKGLRVNVSKTKVMRCQRGAGDLISSGKWPCKICKKGVGRNSIMCTICKKWVHKKCSGVKGRLKEGIWFECSACLNHEASGAKPAEMKEMRIGQDTVLECVDKFCYLGDMIGSGGGAEQASRVRARCAWGKFHELAPILTSRGASLKLKGKIYRCCVQSVLVYGSETWPMKVEDMQRLERAERAMVRWMCGVTLRDRNKSDELRVRLGVEGVADIVRRSRLRWFGHLERKEKTDWVSACRSLKVGGCVGRGRGRRTWRECVGGDMTDLCLSVEMTSDRDLWRRRIHGDRPTCASTEKRTLRR